MERTKCSIAGHVWTVINDGDRIKAAGLRAGCRCACGKMEIYRRRCGCGASHKRVDTIENVKRYRDASS